MKQMTTEETEEMATATGSTKPMTEIVQSTSKYMVPKSDWMLRHGIFSVTLHHM
jgi:hypothetical protein